MKAAAHRAQPETAEAAAIQIGTFPFHDVMWEKDEQVGSCFFHHQLLVGGAYVFTVESFDLFLSALPEPLFHFICNDHD